MEGEEGRPGDRGRECSQCGRVEKAPSEGGILFGGVVLSYVEASSPCDTLILFEGRTPLYHPGVPYHPLQSRHLPVRAPLPPLAVPTLFSSRETVFTTSASSASPSASAWRFLARAVF